MSRNIILKNRLFIQSFFKLMPSIATVVKYLNYITSMIAMLLMTIPPKRIALTKTRYCISGYGNVNGETDIEFHVCGEDFCQQNGNGCHDVEDMDYDGGDCYEGGDCVTDISYCCCDSDLCNGAETDTTETDTTETISDNGAEAIYFSVLTIALTVAMAM